jgi:hypothetical protein
MNQALIVPVLFALTCFAGCAAHRNSEATQGEVTVLELIEHRGERSAMAAAGVAMLAGLVVDGVQSAIQGEAKKLERQFDASKYAGDFWRVRLSEKAAEALRKDVGEADAKAPTKEAPQQGATEASKEALVLKPEDFEISAAYTGFRVKRMTKDFPTAAQPAMEFECSFRLSDNGRLFLIQPKRFITRQAKAKVVNSGGLINSKIDIGIDAMWIGKGQELHQSRIATCSFEVKGYDLAVILPPDGDMPADDPVRVRATGDQITNATEIVAVGYGATRDGGAFSGVRMAVPLVPGTNPCDADTCTPGCERGVEFSAGGNNKDTCGGDSGGPAYIGALLGALTSRSIKTANERCGLGGIYMRVAEQQGWIDEVIAKHR